MRTMRGASPRGVARKPRTRYGIARAGTTPPKPRVWAMRKRDWIEFRASPIRPIRKMSAIEVGGVRLVNYWMSRGEFLGTARVGHGMTIPEGMWISPHQIYPSDMRQGQIVEVPETMTQMLIQGLKNED